MKQLLCLELLTLTVVRYADGMQYIADSEDALLSTKILSNCSATLENNDTMDTK